MMSRSLLTIARFLLAAWVGAATLFVIIGVREVTHRSFDSSIRDQLVLLRFPLYYASGFASLSAALICQLVLIVRGPRRTALTAACALTFAALGLMAFDYPCVYRPLAAMITPPGQARPSQFQSLHRWSETVNSLQLGCVLAAGLTLCAMHNRTDLQNRSSDSFSEP